MKRLNEVGFWNKMDTMLHIQETKKSVSEEERFDLRSIDLA